MEMLDTEKKQNKKKQDTGNLTPCIPMLLCQHCSWKMDLWCWNQLPICLYLAESFLDSKGRDLLPDEEHSAHYFE